MTLKLTGLMQMEFQVPTSKLFITELYIAFTTLFKCLNQPRQRAGDQGFVFRQRQQICIFSNTSRQALWAQRDSNQWAPVFFQAVNPFDA